MRLRQPSVDEAVAARVRERLDLLTRTPDRARDRDSEGTRAGGDPPDSGDVRDTGVVPDGGIVSGVGAAAGTRIPDRSGGSGDPPEPVPPGGSHSGSGGSHSGSGGSGSGSGFPVLLPRSGAVLGAFDPGRRGLRALLAVALLVGVVAGVLTWRARPQPQHVRAVLPAETTVTSSPAPVIVVAVSGRVRRPGLVRLPTGSRVADAVEAAGGVLPGTDLGTLNIARRLTDGELVMVGIPAGSGVAGKTGTAGDGGLLDLNSATADQLDELPGVGPTLAQRIIDYRVAHGGFRSVDELRQVDGIGEAKFAEIRPRVTA